MIDDLPGYVLESAAWLAAGAVVGTLFYLSLRRNVELLVGSASPLKAVGLQLARFATMGIVLNFVGRHYGALPLLTFSAGVLISRGAVIRLLVPP